MCLVSLEITPVHLFCWTNTHTYTYRECLRFVEPRRRPELASLEWSLPVSHALVMPSSANRHEKRAGQGGCDHSARFSSVATLHRQICPAPRNNRSHGKTSPLALFRTLALAFTPTPLPLNLYIFNKWLNLSACVHLLMSLNIFLLSHQETFDSWCFEWGLIFSSYLIFNPADC